MAKERPMAFWDIESLANMFMFAIYIPNTETIDSTSDNKSKDALMFFYLYDDRELSPFELQKIEDAVYEMNPQISKENTTISFNNLKDEAVNKMLVNWFCVDNKRTFGDPDENNFRFINPHLHSDLDEDKKFPYMIGYNTTQYDCTMMAFYFNETWGINGNSVSFLPTTSAFMRQLNNRLFSEAFKEKMYGALEGTEENIYQNMLRSGLYLDAAKINDKVYKMPLKRIMGMEGYDIFEDEIVKGNELVKTLEQLMKLFAYNASDVIKLFHLFQHPAYMAQFQLKKGLLEAYPDLVKDKDGKVRVNRLKIDATSANFAARVLCPDGYLTDTRAVTFEYPKGSGRNILKETREWATSVLPESAMAELNPIFDYYGSIEGHNFDSSEHYDKAYPFDGLPAEVLASFPAPKTCVPYFNADGSITRTYVNFGIGGIHGAEFNLDAYNDDLAEYRRKFSDVSDFISNFTNDELKTLKTTVEIRGVKYKTSQYITKRKDGTMTIKWPKPVELFKKTPSGNWQLNKKYTYCSDDEVDHEDFTSYYPSLLMNLKAFENPALGEDRYVEQFNNKTLYGKYMKDPERSKEEQTYYKTLREGTKLILNSASGAADTLYDNNVRMNNVIIAMRIIGQLFTWRIGQAQTLEGFKITSTNTDGLYAVCNEDTRERCREVLERESKSINVGIEPEEMRLISKDANNRMELSLDGKILSAGGGDVACYKGPQPTKALSHPALIDTLMVEYMKLYGVNSPFDEFKAMDILQNLKNTMDPTKLLLLYQQIVNSSEGTCRYIFARIDGKIRTFQHNNRIFAIKPDGAHLYMANGWNKGVGHDADADEVLRAYGVDPMQYTNTRVIKITKIDPEQNMFIWNKSLLDLDPAIATGLIDNLDDGYYIQMLHDTYNNWCNASGVSSDEPTEESA